MLSPEAASLMDGSMLGLRTFVKPPSLPTVIANLDLRLRNCKQTSMQADRNLQYRVHSRRIALP